MEDGHSLEAIEALPIFRDQPKLYPDLRPIWDMFFKLSSARQTGFAGPQPLSLSEILALFELDGIDDVDDREDTLSLLQHMDRIFMTVMAERKPKGKSR